MESRRGADGIQKGSPDEGGGLRFEPTLNILLSYKLRREMLNSLEIFSVRIVFKLTTCFILFHQIASHAFQ